MGAVDLPIPAVVDKAVAVLPGLSHSACHSLSTVSARGSGGSVTWSRTACRMLVLFVDTTTSHW